MDAPVTMQRALLLSTALALATTSCGGIGSGSGWRTGSPGSTAPVNEDLYSSVRVSRLDDRHFSPEEYWDVVGAVVDDDAFRVEEIGRSVEDRPLRVVRFGRGATQVLLWSQMHGDESTASMALADLFRYLSERDDDPAVRRIRDALTLHVVPVLNPDGAARFQRRNAFGVDVNRDARALATPEGRALKAVHDEVQPDFGFNLHDQGIHIRVGDTNRGAAIALLAPPQDESRSVTPIRDRAMRVASGIVGAIEPLVSGHVTRYDDTFNPRAFGDLMAAWGTSTILIESGGWANDPEKQFLRRVNFVALVEALDLIATGGWQDLDPIGYTGLPMNGRRVADLLVRGGELMLPSGARIQADLLLAYDDPYYETGAVVRDVGDLQEAEARDTLDVTGLVLVPDEAMLDRSALGVQVAPGLPAHFEARRRADDLHPVWVFDGAMPASLRR